MKITEEKLSWAVETTIEMFAAFVGIAILFLIAFIILIFW